MLSAYEEMTVHGYFLPAKCTWFPGRSFRFTSFHQVNWVLTELHEVEQRYDYQDQCSQIFPWFPMDSTVPLWDPATWTLPPWWGTLGTAALRPSQSNCCQSTPGRSSVKCSMQHQVFEAHFLHLFLRHCWGWWTIIMISAIVATLDPNARNPSFQLTIIRSLFGVTCALWNGRFSDGRHLWYTCSTCTQWTANLLDPSCVLLS